MAPIVDRTATPRSRKPLHGASVIMTNNEITVELESANGPKIVYPTGTDGADVDGAAPDGWRVDWETTPAEAGLGRKASPLTRYRYQAQIQSRDTWIRPGAYVVARDVPGGTLTGRVLRQTIPYRPYDSPLRESSVRFRLRAA